jgi:hypothetical protein
MTSCRVGKSAAIFIVYDWGLQVMQDELDRARSTHGNSESWSESSLEMLLTVLVQSWLSSTVDGTQQKYFVTASAPIRCSVSYLKSETFSYSSCLTLGLLIYGSSWFTLLFVIFFYHGATAPSGPGPPRYRGSTITLKSTKHDRTPLDEWSVRRTDLYLTTHNTHNRQQTSMPPVGFELTIPVSKRPQTHA